MSCVDALWCGWWDIHTFSIYTLLVSTTSNFIASGVFETVTIFAVVSSGTLHKRTGTMTIIDGFIFHVTGFAKSSKIGKCIIFFSAIFIRFSSSWNIDQCGAEAINRVGTLMHTKTFE